MEKRSLFKGGGSVKAIGLNVMRKEAANKVTGAAIYTGDLTVPGLLHAKLLISPYAHARIISIDTVEARKMPGVRAIVTGRDIPVLTGSPLEDRPVMAIDKVRYHGEPIAVVVANSEHEAMQACSQIKVDYEPLPVVNSPSEAIMPDAPLVHEQMGRYKQVKTVSPKPGTNIANHTKIRKGDIQQGWAECDIVVEAAFSFPQTDHAAMETRCVQAEILPDGCVTIHASSQGPFIVKKTISKTFQIDMGKITVHTPLVGGGFGGKAAIQLELIAYAASKAVGGRRVKLVNSREEDMIASPVHIGLDASVKLGCTKEGILKAAEVTCYFDGGAYTDEGADISKVAALDCTGPYRVDNVKCDSYSMYTNHPFATAFRGYGHVELNFPIERTLDMLAEKLNMDPVELRLKNVIKPGDTNPSQAVVTKCAIGDLEKCLLELKELIHWDEGRRREMASGKIRAKGISCLWKTSITPTDASSGAIVTFNKDGSVNLNCGVVEIGQATKTVLAQMLAEKLKMDVNRVHVTMDVNTDVNPEHWKTVASCSAIMVGNAVLQAADDAIRQLQSTASIALRCNPEEVEIAEEKAFLRHNPQMFVKLKDIAFGYMYSNGNAVGGQVIGRGSYIMKHLTNIDQAAGTGVPGPEWTVGAQAVEVEFDPRTCTYELVTAVSVIDAGKVLNPKTAQGQVMGGMCMGLGLASREGFLYDANGTVKNQQFRSYKLMRFGENPAYVVKFIETPKLDSPYGARSVGEHGIIGMPGALANSLSTAAQVNLNQLPLTPESIWRLKTEGDS
ncbi:xanthine dehydrogenase family protein molybdopterin-binding subunit [Brevibacillus sp. B_LB10_24]|uniref:xanthine dehydrogenase family protein molybdopterin-binding subunit n=1 Tax=Brevibacillus sp. B_LB10_24 TaxID=3380645 RepID=UPI0038BD86A6